MPTASIVVGVFNRPHQIAQCVASLLTMDSDDFEIILVDDGSTDETPARLEQLQREHAHRPISVIRNKCNLGAAGTRNVGINQAQGEYVLCLDSDCTVERGWLSAMLKELARTGAAAASGTVIDQPPRNMAERACAGSCLLTRKQPNLIEGNMAVRRDLAVRYRFDESLVYGGEGDDLARRLQLDGHRIVFVPSAVVHHHHELDLWGYLQRAVRQSQGHARFWYKHGIYLGRDLLALTAALFTLPLGLLDMRLLAVPAFFALLQVAAILYSEIHFKGKPPREALYILPICIIYYAVRTGSVFLTLIRIACRREKEIRVSKQQWKRHCLS